MSSVTVEINGRETVSQAARDASSSMKRMGDESKSVFDLIKVTAGDVVGAIQGIASSVGEFFTEYAEQEKAVRTFNAAIMQSAQLENGAAERLREYAGAMAIKTGADDEAIQSMIAFLATSGRTETQIRRIIDASADLSTVTGKDLNTTVQQLNKTYSGSAKELATFVDGMKGLSAEELKQGAGVDLVAQKYGGLAAAMGTSTAVALGNLKNTVDDTKAALGEALMPAVQPMLEWLVGFLNDPLIPAIKGFAPIVKDIFGQVQGFITDIKPVVEPIIKWFSDVWALTVGPNIKSIADILKNTLGIISGIITGDWDKVWKKAKEIVTDVLAIISRAFAPITAVIDKIVQGIEKAVNFLKTATKSKGGPVPDSFFDLPMAGYARGTSGARPGVALVGEEGPELVIMHGGETVIPNGDAVAYARALGVPGYADGIENDERTGIAGFGFAGAGRVQVDAPDMSGFEQVFNSIVGAVMPLVDGFIGLLAPLSSVQAILNPLNTIFSAMMDVLGPLINTILAPIVGILRIVGTVLGQMLAPVISALGPIINLIAQGFIWLYNNAIRPLANWIIAAGNMLYNGVVTAINWITSLWGGAQIALKDTTDGQLAEITMSALQSAGTTGYRSSGGSASYEKPRDITVNVVVTTAALVGDDGISQFALIIGRELKAAGVLGVA